MSKEHLAVTSMSATCDVLPRKQATCITWGSLFEHIVATMGTQVIVATMGTQVIVGTLFQQ
jgi:hypothetical protein